MSAERLQKLLARAGVASRRAAEGLIAAGRVTVDGRVVTEPGTQADPAVSAIAVDGVVLQFEAEFSYFLLNKPKGVLSTCDDPRGRQTVLAYVPLVPGLHPVGRLDADTSGLIVLTNDGSFTQALAHPRHGVSKTYLAEVEGRPGPEAIAALRRGVPLEDGPTRPAVVQVLERRRETTVLELTIKEGRNRQVRRMTEAVGHPIRTLARVAIGPLADPGLAPGRFRPLTPEEVARLRALATKGAPRA